jgi:hypothetical protein
VTPAMANAMTRKEAPTAHRPRKPIIAKVRHLNAREIYAKAPDADVEGFRARLKEIFATASPLFVEASLRQLIAAAKLPDSLVASTVSLSASLELIASLEPSTEAESALALHVACLHMASITVMSRLRGITERNVVAMATAAAKIERAFHSALETYQQMKRGVTQIVRVERINIEPGAQAIVGCVRNEQIRTGTSGNHQSSDKDGGSREQL